MAAYAARGRFFFFVSTLLPAFLKNFSVGRIASPRFFAKDG